MTDLPKSYLLKLFRELQDLETKPLETWGAPAMQKEIRAGEIEIAETKLAREILDCATRNLR